MPDPFEALRVPVESVAPDPDFASQLRARLARLFTSEEETMTSINVETGVGSATAQSASGGDQGDAVRRPRQGDVVYASLWVRDAERAAVFFGAVVGWECVAGEEPQERRIVGTSLPMGIYGGQDRGTLFCCYEVADVDAAVERVRGAGGSSEEILDRPYGRVVDCVDDQGTRFALLGMPHDPARVGTAEHGSAAGDLGYITMQVVDSGQARAFYSAVLGWSFTPGQVEDGWQVEGTAPMTGMHGGNAEATIVPLYRVDDMSAAVTRVREAGGVAGETNQRPYGLECLCEDDQGTSFYLWQL